MYNVDDLKIIFNKYGYDICEHTVPVQNCKENTYFKDGEGYILRGTLDNMRNQKGGFRRIHTSNPYSIYNINLTAEQIGITSRCIEEKYLGSKANLLFKCGCGNTFRTTYSNFISGHKNKCDDCSNCHRNYPYEEVKQKLSERGYELILPKSEYKGITLSPLTCVNNEGYKCNVYFHKIMNGRNSYFMHPSNPYSLENIKHFLFLHNIPFELVDNKYVSNETPMLYKCKRCGNEVKAAWCNINIFIADGTKGRIYCPNCDGTLESLQAIALKQMFVHEYPDTIPEERSCINPNTGYAMPTDIVNHRLQIAIEVQSQWHDTKQDRDKIKKDFWINKGYKFYAPDIRDYNVLEMLQLFFDVDEIPDYIDFSYANKLNIKLIQKMLDDLMSPTEISNKLEINVHRIYDAIRAGNLHYNENYIKGKSLC